MTEADSLATILRLTSEKSRLQVENRNLKAGHARLMQELDQATARTEEVLKLVREIHTTVTQGAV